MADDDDKAQGPRTHTLSEMAIALGLDDMYTGTIVESSNPGPVGVDTGYEFDDPKTGQKVRVLQRRGESRRQAINRVRKNHGL